jgi:hypothetical protein
VRFESIQLGRELGLGLGLPPGLGLASGVGRMPGLGLPPGLGLMPGLGLPPGLGLTPGLGLPPGLGLTPGLGLIFGEGRVLSPRPAAAKHKKSTTVIDGHLILIRPFLSTRSSSGSYDRLFEASNWHARAIADRRRADAARIEH